MERPSKDQDLLDLEDEETFRGVGEPAKQRTVLEPPKEEGTQPEPAGAQGDGEHL